MPKVGFGRIKVLPVYDHREVYWTDAATVSHGRLFIAIGQSKRDGKTFRYMRWWMRRHGKHASGVVRLNGKWNEIKNA